MRSILALATLLFAATAAQAAPIAVKPAGVTQEPAVQLVREATEGARQADRRADRQANRQADRQADRQVAILKRIAAVAHKLDD